MTARTTTTIEPSLAGRTVVITRPAGTGSPLARQVRRRGGAALLLPGLSLHGVERSDETIAAMRAALDDDLLVFTSPAAVRFAVQLLPLQTRAAVLAVGQGTARALRRHGVAEPLLPTDRQDSEGLLDHPRLARLQGRHVALIGAPGGRGVLREQLAARGARLREVHVYRRGVPRWQARQLAAVMHLPLDARVLLSSAEALANLRQGLPAAAFNRLRGAVAVASSERLATAAREAGFARIEIAASAWSPDMLAAAAR
ncbi:MAG TPA: uroporphyrinogen-III synthase [Dyella sp.]|uniref:uroporphyrinogen-III synthase n=1 Tax=Dyella sp. TaxID=1869338 RepID=UPI002D789D2E|nr:uroporphyrinogen-III synthase [Dyella sp.]HET6552411.1 uroporphyrinogen-III synthase [Dyella sp.]